MHRLFRNAALAFAAGTLAAGIQAQGTLPPGSASSPANSSAGEAYPGGTQPSQVRKHHGHGDRKYQAATGRDGAGAPRDAASQSTRRPTDARPAAAAPAATPGAPAVQTQSDRVDATGAAPSTGESTRTPAAAPSTTR